VFSQTFTLYKQKSTALCQFTPLGYPTHGCNAVILQMHVFKYTASLFCSFRSLSLASARQLGVNPFDFYSSTPFFLGHHTIRKEKDAALRKANSRVSHSLLSLSA